MASTMRVALDARCLQDAPLGGVGRATRAVVDAVRDDVDLVLLTDSDRPPIRTDVPQRRLTSRLPTKAAWLQLAVPRMLRDFDGIFHCPWYGLPFRQPVPMMVTIYDLSFEHGSVGFSRHQRLAYRVQARWAARTAIHILTGAEVTRAELIARYGVESSRVGVQPSPLDPALAQVDAERARAIRSKLDITGRYVLALGGARRRRLDLALEGWSLARQAVPDVSLVVVGETRVEGEPPGVVAAGVVDDAAWAALLQGADALVYPTEFEGYGYPAAEAMALGTPVICGRVGSLPEVVGDAGYWLTAHEPPAIAEAIVGLLTHPERASELARRGRSRMKGAFELDQLRACLLDAYDRTLSTAV